MEDLRLLAESLGTGKIKPVIDRRYALEQMAEAHRYVDEGRKRGALSSRWTMIIEEKSSFTVGHDYDS